jgi:DNA-binding transcriptional MerR regulator
VELLLILVGGGDTVSDTMTIQTFSIRTGLPSSTLRYYEKESLILPDVRGENGYRQYREEQIPRAITIHSLRQAGVNLSDIRQYFLSDDADKVNWMKKWRKDIDSKLASLNVARQFLHGIEPEDEHIRLIKWETPVSILWFRHRVKRERYPFAGAIEERAAYLKKHGRLRYHDAYVRQERIEGNEMIGTVGFRLDGKEAIPKQWLSDAEIEMIQPTLFVTLDCLADDDFACFSLMLLLQSFGFEPSGPNIERYQLNDLSTYQWMIPVLHEDSAT